VNQKFQKKKKKKKEKEKKQKREDTPTGTGATGSGVPAVRAPTVHQRFGTAMWSCPCGYPRLQPNPLGALWDRFIPRTTAIESICSQAQRAATRAQYCALALIISHLLNTTFVVLTFFTKK